MVTRRIARGVSGVIGLGQEAYAYNAEKRASAKHDDEDVLSTPRPDPETRDEAPPGYSNFGDQSGNTSSSAFGAGNGSQTPDDDIDAGGSNSGESKLSAEILLRLYPPTTPSQPGKLPAPVMIPLRRPEASMRGFIRAYAPELASCDVNRAAFLGFLDGLEQCTRGHGMMHVANIAVALSVLTYTASCGPSAAVHFSALAVHSGIEAGRRMYINSQRSSFMDEMNEGFFKPRGLYAMIMRYDAEGKDDELIDFDARTWNAISKRDDPNRGKSTRLFTSAAGKTLASQMPDVCNLEFPESSQDSAEQHKNGLRRTAAFVADYNDRRGQALFAEHNPGSQLNVNQKTFAGRYADPTTFENSGIIGILTGGRIDPGQRRWERRNARRVSRGQRPLQPGESGGLIGTALKPVRAALRTGVVYLLVVNLPTESELAYAAAMKAKARQEKPKW